MLKMKMTFDLQSKMEVIEACFILVTFALFFSNAFYLFPQFPLRRAALSRGILKYTSGRVAHGKLAPEGSSRVRRDPAEAFCILPNRADIVR
jgi:hypothetical protein